eukprot:3032662-Pleurochrysis_carterae.AAC.1
MELAGSALAGQSGRTPCIGFATWNKISHREILMDRGKTQNYRASALIVVVLTIEHQHRRGMHRARFGTTALLLSSTTSAVVSILCIY